MPPHDRDPAMAAAEGIIVGLALSLGGVAIVAAVAWLGAPALRYAAWVVLVIREAMG